MIIINSKIMGSISIFYHPEDNLFKDGNGRVILNLYKLIHPNRIFLFKHEKKNYEFVNYEHGVIVKLLYPIRN